MNQLVDTLFGAATARRIGIRRGEHGGEHKGAIAPQESNHAIEPNVSSLLFDLSKKSAWPQGCVRGFPLFDAFAR